MVTHFIIGMGGSGKWPFYGNVIGDLKKLFYLGRGRNSSIALLWEKLCAPPLLPWMISNRCIVDTEIFRFFLLISNEIGCILIIFTALSFLASWEFLSKAVHSGSWVTCQTSFLQRHFVFINGKIDKLHNVNILFSHDELNSLWTLHQTLLFVSKLGTSIGENSFPWS